MPEADYNATVIQRVEVAPGLVILRVVPDDPLFSFEPGQYTVLGLKRSARKVLQAERAERAEPGDQGPQDPGKMIRRAYSIASSSRPGEFVEFYVTLVNSGELTPRLFHLRLKDRLFMGKKATGIFTLNRVPERYHLLLVATGTGLAPYMSMIRTELDCGGPRRFAILHGARFSWDLGYRTELTGLARNCSNVTYLPVVSRPNEDPSWRGATGYLQDLLFSGLIEEKTGLDVTPENFHVFLCGNPGMIEAATKRLVARGFVKDKGRETGSIHTEEYW